MHLIVSTSSLHFFPVGVKSPLPKQHSSSMPDDLQHSVKILILWFFTIIMNNTFSKIYKTYHVYIPFPNQPLVSKGSSGISISFTANKIKLIVVRLNFYEISFKHYSLWLFLALCSLIIAASNWPINLMAALLQGVIWGEAQALQ